ncbi:hypothetical protein Tco_1088133 [Tanacetum coccineum]
MSSSESVHGSFGGDAILTSMGFVVDRGWRDIGKVQIVLDFENSALRLPSVEKGFKNLIGSIRTPGGKQLPRSYFLIAQSCKTGPGFHDSVGQKRKRSGNFCRGQKNRGAGDFLLPHQMAAENMGSMNSRTEDDMASTKESEKRLIGKLYIATAAA